MNHPNDRISSQTAADAFALAAKLQAQRHQDYSTAELMQAAAEANISPEALQEALKLMQAKQMEDQTQRDKLRLMLGSGAVGVAIALSSIWAYTAMTRNPAWSATSSEINAVQPNPRNANQLTASTSQPPDSPPVPLDNNATTLTGKIQQYLLNPEGRVDGLLLNNGLQVKVPPHLNRNLVAQVSLGTEISVTGKTGVSTSFGQEIKAREITNRQTQQTITNKAIADAPPPAPTPTDYSSLSAEGKAQKWLVGHRGEINGVILSSGVQVKFPPHIGNQLVDTAQVGDKVQVQGFGTRNKYGEVIKATTLKVNERSVGVAP
ncbi:hypothetical protein [Brasilonema octagenarum]|uniref:DUF5666 domain-containing protein n=1 Tax=Brasilonema octagenarum UFV-OR1 TaxID=417115 RepID=A0ABX1M3Y6_9CYAN|nr:hypothetical protein [Brasilonema octagenarum]NMF63230.1 hypothetical protein [Brasilonema octagenarum UFV-OR1]